MNRSPRPFRRLRPHDPSSREASEEPVSCSGWVRSLTERAVRIDVHGAPEWLPRSLVTVKPGELVLGQQIEYLIPAWKSRQILAARRAGGARGNQ